jgi:CRP-like cAMP-binding protein
MHSPLLQDAIRYPDDREVHDWFRLTYPTYCRPASSPLLEKGEFLDLLATCVAGDPLRQLPLLREFDRQEANRVLAQAALIHVPAGAQVIRRHDRDSTLYVLLSGTVDVLSDGLGSPSCGILSAGDTFGEKAFVTGCPRAANLVARTPASILVIPGDFLEMRIQEEPALGIKILRNLAQGLAQHQMTALAGALPVTAAASA